MTDTGLCFPKISFETQFLRKEGIQQPATFDQKNKKQPATYPRSIVSCNAYLIVLIDHSTLLQHFIGDSSRSTSIN